MVLIWGHLENVYPITSSPSENTKRQVRGGFKDDLFPREGSGNAAGHRCPLWASGDMEYAQSIATEVLLLGL